MPSGFSCLSNHSFFLLFLTPSFILLLYLFSPLPSCHRLDSIAQLFASISHSPPSVVCAFPHIPTCLSSFFFLTLQLPVQRRCSLEPPHRCVRSLAAKLHPKRECRSGARTPAATDGDNLPNRFDDDALAFPKPRRTFFSFFFRPHPFPLPPFPSRR